MKNRKIAVIDCETNPAKFKRKLKPFIWGFYDGNTYEQFDDSLDLIAYLYDKPYIVYAHNGGKFDYHFILNYIEPFTKITVINGRLAKFKIGDCEFRDSYNILPTALSEFNKQEFDYSLLEEDKRNDPRNKKLIEDYLYSDCVNLYNYVHGFIDRFGLNLTVAGTAFKQWQLISSENPPHDENGNLYEELKCYYYGGRCEAFEFGEIHDDFSMVDINSAYPYAMLENHPFSTNFTIEFENFDKLTREEKQTTLITLECYSTGCLPYRGTDGSLFFPADNKWREFYITGWEFLAGIDTGAITDYKIKKYVIFDKLINFKTYVEKFYNERKTAKKTGDILSNIFAKLMMNGLYGKFASNPDNYKNYMTINSELLEEEQYHDYENYVTWHYAGDLGDVPLVSRDIDDYEKHFYNLGTSASITGYVRAYLWRALCGCKGVLYCDTDSIAAREVENLPNGFGDNLGQWETEGEFDYAAIGGKKLYAFRHKNDTHEYKTASKGAILSPDQLISIAQGETVTYNPEFPTFSVHKPPSYISRVIKMQKKALQE